MPDGEFRNKNLYKNENEIKCKTYSKPSQLYSYIVHPAVLNYKKNNPRCCVSVDFPFFE